MTYNLKKILKPILFFNFRIKSNTKKKEEIGYCPIGEKRERKKFRKLRV